MVNPHDIRQRIEAALPGARVAVADTTGAGDHFDVQVTAPAFAGRALVEQHRLVYEALGNLMREVHALSLRTQAPEESTR